jgi:hypothetical protein
MPRKKKIDNIPLDREKLLPLKGIDVSCSPRGDYKEFRFYVNVNEWRSVGFLLPPHVADAIYELVTKGLPVLLEEKNE